MDAIGEKLAKQFKLTAAEVDALRAAGLDTPRKIRDAQPDDLPPGIADKLSGRLRAAVNFAAPAPAPRAKKRSAAEG